MGQFCTLTLALWSRSPYLPTLSNLGSSSHLSRLKFRFLCFIKFKADDGFSNHKTHKTNRKMKYEYLLLRQYCCLRNHQNFFADFRFVVPVSWGSPVFGYTNSGFEIRVACIWHLRSLCQHLTKIMKFIENVSVISTCHNFLKANTSTHLIC